MQITDAERDALHDADKAIAELKRKQNPTRMHCKLLAVATVKLKLNVSVMEAYALVSQHINTQNEK